MEFSSLQYFRAMAPLNLVIDAFNNEEKSGGNDHDVWSTQSQSRFTAMIASSQCLQRDLNVYEIEWDKIQFLPSERYVQKLVKRYTTRLEMENKEVEDDNLASLICYLSQSRISNLPDPTNPSVVTYHVPLLDENESNAGLKQMQKDDPLLSIQIYPQHNDVGVAKVWEAGAALAEYIIYNPFMIKDRNVVELGAGVGLTGLVAAAYGAKSVHMTDYTVPTLENLKYNVKGNEKWLLRRGVDSKSVSVVSNGFC